MLPFNLNGPAVILVMAMISTHHYIAAGSCAHWSIVSSLSYAKMLMSFYHATAMEQRSKSS